MRSLAMVALALTFTLSAAAGDGRSARMQVSAHVLARAVVSVETQPAEVTVTEADIARGYVDVAEPVEVRIRTNSRRGCVLQVANANEAFSAVELEFGNTTMRVASHESWVTRPYVEGGELVRMNVRVRLAPGAAAGRHILPLAISATAL